MEPYRTDPRRKGKPLSEAQKEKRRAQYEKKREELKEFYKANREMMLARVKENTNVRRLEAYKRQLIEIRNSTNNLEIKQFINLIVGNPALFNANKHVMDFLREVAGDFPYNNGASFAVHSAYDMLREETSAKEPEVIDEPELNILIL